MQNLRNKYKNHPVIRPLIEHCEGNNLSFELVKETIAKIGIKSFNYETSYYMTIGDNLIVAKNDSWQKTDLFRLIVRAYRYLGLEYHENLVMAARAFKRKI